MDILLILIPLAFCLGLGGLLAFMWALRTGQFEDMEGSSNRILAPDEEDKL